MARALDLHSRGQGFDSLILHRKAKCKIKKAKKEGNRRRETGKIGARSEKKKAERGAQSKNNEKEFIKK